MKQIQVMSFSLVDVYNWTPPKNKMREREQAPFVFLRGHDFLIQKLKISLAKSLGKLQY